MRMMPIASGSSGNCIYLGTEDTHVLFDAGVSRKRIEEGLNTAGLSLKDIDAIFVTHEHIDHTKGLGVISRKDGIPIYSTPGTIEGIEQTSSLGNIPEGIFNKINADEDISIGDTFTQKCANGIKKASVVTDLGYFDDYVVDNLTESDIMLVEANHDINMLQVGPYPFYLKKRILGNKGHLSNETSGQLVNSLLHDKLKKIYLGHLSKENNYDKLAYETVKLEIDMSDNSFKSSDFDIEVAKRDVLSGICEI